MKTVFRFFLRIAIAWGASFLAMIVIFEAIFSHGPPKIVVLAWFVLLALFLSAGVRHYRRVKLLAGEVTASSLAGRQERQIEIPFDFDTAFDMVAACLEELPLAEPLRGAKTARQIHALIKRPESGEGFVFWQRIPKWLGVDRNRITAVLVPREGVVSLTLVCESEGGAWAEWFLFDDGGNLVNADVVARAITRRIGEFRKGEQQVAKENVTEKELAVARLGLLHAQVEPHFLYNTLGSAKYLIQSDPARAEAMLDNLILYLRNSLPRTDDEGSTLGQEVARARAYLEILQIRMGDRLRLNIDVPAQLENTPFPTMMLQTLVENAIKHGLEPKPEGGSIWLLARTDAAVPPTQLIVTVADDGCGLDSSPATAGTGIGLKNVRERLRLAYDGKASFAITANFPAGVATTITVPLKSAASATPAAPVTPANGVQA